MVSSQPEDLGSIDALQFTKDSTYTTFLAEYAFKGNDIIFHFFRSEIRDNDYWKELFPSVFEKVVLEHFEDTYPRLAATYTQEMDSWWLRARNFVDIGNPKMRSEKLFEKLDAAIDQALEARKSNSPRA